MLAALAIAAFNAQAAELKVIGSIIPGACDITLGNGGIVDFGAQSKTVTMALAQIVGHYAPASKSLPFTLTCSAPTPLAISVADNKSTTLSLLGDSTDPYRYGLGLTGSSKIGAYTIGHTDFLIVKTAGGAVEVPAGLLARPIASAATAPFAIAGLDAIYFGPSNALAFSGDRASLVPIALVGVKGNLVIQPLYNKDVIDKSNTEIKLDGSATISVNYL